MDAMCSLVPFLLLLCLLPSSFAEVFTSVADIRRALQVAASLADRLRRHQEVLAGEGRGELLRGIAASLEQHSQMFISRSRDDFLHDPVNNYLLIKDLVSQWQKAQDLIKNEGWGADFLRTLETALKAFPSKDDIEGATLGLLRLQETYKLGVEDIVKGDLPRGAHVDRMPLSINDCFDIGTVAYKYGKYFQSTVWLYEVMQQLQKGGRGVAEPSEVSTEEDINQGVLFKYLADSLYFQGQTSEALALAKAWVLTSPNSAEAKSARKYYKRRIREERLGTESRTAPAPHHSSVEYKPGLVYGQKPNTKTFGGTVDNFEFHDSFESVDERHIYEEICRSGLNRDQRSMSDLSCRYRHYPSWFVLAPMMEETLNEGNPEIIMYHKILSSSEVRLIKAAAEPDLGRSLVYSSESYTRTFSRTSKSSWLTDSIHPLIAKSSYKMAALANLSLDTAEDLQVLNYGIGGHYSPHFDFIGDSATLWRTGNRVATVLCYLSDVPSGGATVFTKAEVSVWPEKGACVLWFNLLRNGRKDYSSRHAACPVLVGSKWVANKWFHETGQEFNRPCSLSPDE